MAVVVGGAGHLVPPETGTPVMASGEREDDDLSQTSTTSDGPVLTWPNFGWFLDVLNAMLRISHYKASPLLTTYFEHVLADVRFVTQFTPDASNMTARWSSHPTPG